MSNDTPDPNNTDPNHYIMVRHISPSTQRGVNYIPNVSSFWVGYRVYRNGEVVHVGDRLVHAKDELAVYQKFATQMHERHGTNNVRWDMMSPQPTRDPLNPYPQPVT
jgi:hypothetical protein